MFKEVASQEECHVGAILSHYVLMCFQDTQGHCSTMINKTTRNKINIIKEM